MSDMKQSDSIVEMFIFESNQLTEQLENILLDSESNKTLTTDNINEIFRIMHTIKGSSAMMDLINISTVAHKLEDLFFYFRETPGVKIDVSSVCDIVFKGLDFIRNNIEDYQNGIVKTDDAEADNLKQVISDYISSIKDDSNPKESTSAPLKVAENTEKSDNNSKKNQNYKATVFFSETCSMHIARAFMVINKLSKYAENLYYYPENLENDVKTVSYIIDNGFELNFYCELSYYDIKDLIEDISEVKTAIIQGVEAVDTEVNSASNNKVEANTPDKNSDKSSSEVKKSAPVKQSIISVNINKLDSLMDIVGEIVIAESMVFNNPDLAGLELKRFEKATRQLQKLTDELQDLALSVRMVPIEMCFNKMQRIVRDMSKKLDKEVELKIIGESTEVDKNVIDGLSDPIMHLIRNCMDHGLETREERGKTNKNSVGTITLEAQNTGSDIIITVSDDGKGLNREKIYEKAKKNGLITKDYDSITDKEIYNLILMAGFSTKENITEFSGRGVGMDVVKKNIEAVRGSVQVESVEGEGTSIIIKIPLTLAIIDGMSVGVGENIYILPTQSIVQTFRPDNNDVFLDVEGNKMVRVRENCYPIVELSKMYNTVSNVENPTDGILIMTEENDKTICLFADCLLGQQPIVVKSLPMFLSRYNLKQKGLGGCTILGDGNISLILDVSEIINGFYN